MTAWLHQHRAALGRALRRLLQTPFVTLLSLLVIGIALTLPATGYVLLSGLGEVSRNVSGSPQISVFMAVDASRKEVAEIEGRLRRAAPDAWRFVPKEDALKRLQASEGMAEIVAALPRNPLPDAFVVEPANAAPEALEVLRKELAGWPKVAHVQLDSAWVKRLDAFLRLGRLALWVLAGIFSVGLVAATFNIIRLQVMAQAAEIEVARMIGATDAFIRRPFYYYGTLQGALGGLLGAAFAAGIVALLRGPAGELAALYGGSFALPGPDGGVVAALAGAGALLGWIGARLSVGLSLRRID
ncbi:MAG: ABC transporter permease [Betaproteobacteria bacterium]|nr:ABC transporter permease [Betaproteobacteria bacterium]